MAKYLSELFKFNLRSDIVLAGRRCGGWDIRSLMAKSTAGGLLSAGGVHTVHRHAVFLWFCRFYSL